MLKMIVLTNIINEKYGVAKKFLDVLNKSILHKKWVRHYREYLSNETLIESDSLIQLKRKLMPKFDFFISVSRVAERDLVELLKEDENNKMAFEYLMASYLLAFRLEDLLKYIGWFKKLGYQKYPQCIEEALLSVKLIYPSKEVKHDFIISAQTAKGFEQFNYIFSQYENVEMAEAVLRNGFYHTYWYYLFYIRPKEEDIE
jgi:hypothetical protein